ncbi:MAG: type II toxin-antitoxin system VapC family toxin [Gemmatimonadaceae bacterium]
MNLLLDTHTLVWWLGGDTRLSRRARTAIADENNAVHVSAASAWEIAIKYRLGRLPEAEVLISDFSEHITGQGFDTLDITVDHGLRAGILAGPHRDPFDRMLAAQAQSERLTLVSNDQVFDAFGVSRVW